MVTLVRWFQATGKQKAIEALDQLADLLPSKAQRVTDADVAEIACVDIVAGDRLQIRAGERFPTDAILIDGETTVDEQVFTGESTPLGAHPRRQDSGRDSESGWPRRGQSGTVTPLAPDPVKADSILRLVSECDRTRVPSIAIA